MERSWFDRENGRRLIPFAAAAVVGLALAALNPEPPLLNVVLAAAALLAIGASTLSRWAQPPAPLAVLPPLALLLVVGLLRAGEGAGTGFGPLAMLSVFWIALYGRRWQLLVVLGGVGILFALPLTGLIGAGYTATDLRTVVMWVAVSALVGLTAQALVSRERAQRRSLTAQHAFLDAIFTAAGSLVAVLDADGRVTGVNPACERAGGFSEREIAGRFFWEVLMAPRWARAMARWWEEREPAARAGVAETPMVSSTGEELTIHWTLEALLDERGEVANFVATGLDVTAQRQAEAKVAASEYQLRAVLSHLPGTVVSLFDRELRCQMIEGASLTERGIDPGRLVGGPLEQAVPAENAARLRPALEAALGGETACIEYESHRDGAIFEVDVLPYGRGARIEGALTVSRDVTERRRFERELQELAEFDSLSGLLNRRAFERELRRHLIETARHECVGALLLIDVDRFKAVNDTLGHARGDELIVAIARTLDEHLRGGDVAGRLGGDEFAVLLPRADRAEAETVARRLVETVRALELMPTGEPPRPVTISLGATNFSKGSHLRPERPLIEADLAMYEAKAAGGDGLRFRDGSLSMFFPSRAG